MMVFCGSLVPTAYGGVWQFDHRFSKGWKDKTWNEALQALIFFVFC